MEGPTRQKKRTRQHVQHYDLSPDPRACVSAAEERGRKWETPDRLRG